MPLFCLFPALAFLYTYLPEVIFVPKVLIARLAIVLVVSVLLHMAVGFGVGTEQETARLTFDVWAPMAISLLVVIFFIAVVEFIVAVVAVVLGVMTGAIGVLGAATRGRKGAITYAALVVHGAENGARPRWRSYYVEVC